MSAAVAWFRENPDERIPWIGSPPMGLFGNAQRHAVAIVQAALADQSPADLPATLASVDDVRRVCEAAGLTPVGQDSWVWSPVLVETTETCVSVVHDEVAAWSVQVSVGLPGAPSSVLWHAIQAARSAS